MWNPFLVTLVLILFALTAVRIAGLSELRPVTNHRIGQLLLVGSRGGWYPEGAETEQELAGRSGEGEQRITARPRAG